MVPLTVQFGENRLWVTFLVDTGAPMTYLSAEALRALASIPRGTLSRVVDALVHGTVHRLVISPPQSHYSDVNILGIDFLQASHLRLEVGFPPPESGQMKYCSLSRYSKVKEDL